MATHCCILAWRILWTEKPGLESVFLIRQCVKREKLKAWSWQKLKMSFCWKAHPPPRENDIRTRHTPFKSRGGFLPGVSFGERQGHRGAEWGILLSSLNSAAPLFTLAELPVRANGRRGGAEYVQIRLTCPAGQSYQGVEQRPDAFPQREMKQERGHR